MSFARGIASGMAYLHANRVLHWDVKPSNFLISRDWEVKEREEERREGGVGEEGRRWTEGVAVKERTNLIC